jgi:hypothetical protein
LKLIHTFLQKIILKPKRKECAIVESKTVKIQILRIRFLRHFESNFSVYKEKLGGCNCISWEGNIGWWSGFIRFQISAEFFTRWRKFLSINWNLTRQQSNCQLLTKNGRFLYCSWLTSRLLIINNQELPDCQLLAIFENLIFRLPR